MSNATPRFTPNQRRCLRLFHSPLTTILFEGQHYGKQDIRDNPDLADLIMARYDNEDYLSVGHSARNLETQRDDTNPDYHQAETR